MQEDPKILFDNDTIQPLVVEYKNAKTEEEQHYYFCEIALACIPMIKWVSRRNESSWLKQINESDVNAIVSEITLKLPKLLDKFNPDNKTTFFSYFTKSVENKFRHWNRGINVRKKYSTEWPIDPETGEPIDIPDGKTVKHNSLETEKEKYMAFEQAKFILPLEVASTFPQPHQNLIRFIAKRFLDKTDNKEQLFISELVNEISQLPIARGFCVVELNNLVRLAISIIRSNLYSLREEMTESECIDYVANLLENGDPKIWGYLGVFDAVTTVKLLHCFAGVLPAIPPINRLIRKKSYEEAIG
jgi:hypothetical protein